MNQANYVTGVNPERNSCFHKHKISLVDLGLFAVTGIYLIVVGCVIIIKCKYFTFLSSNYSLMLFPSLVFIFAGIGFVFCGVLMYGYNICRKKETSQLHENYFLMISVFVIVFYVISCFSSAYCFDVKRNNLNSSFQAYDPENRTDLSVSIDYLQKSFQCCGLEDHSDWLSTAYGTEPESCYINITDNTRKKLSIEERKLHNRGCYNVIRYHFYEIVVYLIWCTVSVVNVLCGCMMYKHIGCSVTDASHWLRRSYRGLTRKRNNPRRSEARIWINMRTPRPRHVWETVEAL